MKKLFLFALAAIFLASCNSNKTENSADNMAENDSTEQIGKFQVYDLDGFKLHVYNTNDDMNDASFIIEGEKGLVVMEYPLFKANAVEFAKYIEALNKPTVTDITDYHLGGSGKLPITMPEGMPAFIKGHVYDGMMKGFAEAFGDAMVELPEQETIEVPFGKTQQWAGVDFLFEQGASSDFPAASIIIGKQVYYTHWAPAEMHMSPLQITNAAAVDAELAEAKKSLASGCRYFIGGHGGLAGKKQVEFKIDYLTKVKQLLSANADADKFSKALMEAYPDLLGDAEALAQALYSKK